MIHRPKYSKLAKEKPKYSKFSFKKDDWYQPISITCTFFKIVFLWEVSTLEIYQLYGDVTISGKGQKMFTHTQHSWTLISEGSLACHTYCSTEHPLIWSSVIKLLPSVWKWSCYYLFRDLGLSRPRFELQTIRGEHSNRLHQRPWLWKCRNCLKILLRINKNCRFWKCSTKDPSITKIVLRKFCFYPTMNVGFFSLLVVLFALLCSNLSIWMHFNW